MASPTLPDAGRIPPATRTALIIALAIVFVLCTGWLDGGAGVLNADIAPVAELAELCDGEVLLYALSADNATLTQHRAQPEARAVFVRGEHICLATGAKERVLGSLAALRPAVGSTPDTTALLAAIAGAWALGIAPDLIAAGIKTFEYQH